MPSLDKDYGPLLAIMRFRDRGTLATDRLCEAAKFHAPKPLVLRLVSLTPWLTEVDGSAVDDAWVCGTCADLLAMYQQFLSYFDGHVPYDIANRFSVSLRHIAMKGWNLYKLTIP